MPFLGKYVTVFRLMAIELTVEKRDIKASPNTLRLKGVLPAVVYGRKEESTPIAVNRKEFEKIFHKAGESTVIKLKGLGTDKDVLIHEVSVDALTGTALHADFYAIAEGQTVTVSVPLEFEGEAPAVKDLGTSSRSNACRRTSRTQLW